MIRVVNSRFSGKTGLAVRAFLLLVAVVAGAGAGFGQDAVKDDPLTPADADLAARIAAVRAADYAGKDVMRVLDRTDVEVAESGLSTMTFHRVDRVLTVAGAVGEAVRSFDYDPKSSGVEIVRIRLWRDGKPRDLDLAGLRDTPAPDWSIFWGNRLKVFTLPRLKPGDAVETEHRRKGFVLALLADEDAEQRFIPPMRGHFFDIVPFWSDRPVKEKIYTVRLPRGKNLRTQFFNGTAETEARVDGETAFYRWTARDVAPLEREPGMSAPDDVAPKLIVTTTLDWREKSAWFHQANEDYGSFTVTPEVKAFTDALLKGARDDDEKISILTHWAAENIRYCGLSMGKGEGYILHTGEMTFQDRCGVCKDKAGMLVTLLRAAGFESYPAMTMAGSRVEDIPADQFNHCVTLVKRPTGYQLLDPTWVPGSMELWSSLEQEQQYLPGVPETSGLLTTPAADPAEHFIRITSTLDLAADGKLSGRASVETRGLGDSFMRRAVQRTVAARRADIFRNALAEISPLMKLTGYDCSSPEDLKNAMKIALRFECPDFAQAGEKSLRLRAPALAQYFADPGLAFFLQVRTDKPDRKYPLSLRCNGTWSWEETVKAPPGYRLARPPDDLRIDGAAASLERTVKALDDGFVVKQTLVLKKKTCPPSDYPNLKQVLDALRKERGRVFALVAGGDK
ncbi:MAG: DUF3857 domain-containing protein [Acidobacteria bacterium]|nr:DUF3857 domain-containing protein [Acidobacteriota bacterium]